MQVNGESATADFPLGNTKRDLEAGAFVSRSRGPPRKRRNLRMSHSTCDNMAPSDQEGRDASERTVNPPVALGSI